MLSKALALMTMKLRNVGCMLVNYFEYCDLIRPLLEITVNSFSLDLGTELTRALTPLSLIHL